MGEVALAVEVERDMIYEPASHPAPRRHDHVDAEQLFLERVVDIYSKISELDSLEPGEAVNGLFSRLVGLCISPGAGGATIDVRRMKPQIQEIRAHLILLCGQAEGLLERHYAGLLGALPEPSAQLHLFPYYSNYRKLAALEYQMLSQCCAATSASAASVAFVGSGPLPLTSLVLAQHHMPLAQFHNYDVDGGAHELARVLVAGDPELGPRMAFHVANILHVGDELAVHDVVFLAALVGMDRASKTAVIQHLAKHMKAGATLVARSAHGARAFLYPIVDRDMLEAPGFEVLSVFHPSDEVVNSVVIARLKPPHPSPASTDHDYDDDDDDDHEDDLQEDDDEDVVILHRDDDGQEDEEEESS